MSNEHELPLSVWPVAQQTLQRQRAHRYLPESSAHPARMVPALARRAIETYTNVGDVVIDPMCGAGTTLVESMHLGRRGFGVELEPRWVELSRANIAHAIAQGATGTANAVVGDARQLASLVPKTLRGRVALVLTSPPYGPSTHGQVRTSKDGLRKKDFSYSDDRSNLAHASPDALFDAFGSILEACREVLRPGGVVVVTVRPWRRNGALVDLPAAVERVGEQAGLVPLSRHVALLAGLRGDALVPRPSFFQLDNIRKARQRGIPLAVISHEDVIVLRAPHE